MENLTAKVQELTGDIENRVTELRFGDSALVTISWKEKRFMIMNTEGPKAQKALIDSFDDLCFRSQGLLYGIPLRQTIEVGLSVYECPAYLS